MEISLHKLFLNSTVVDVLRTGALNHTISIRQKLLRLACSLNYPPRFLSLSLHKWQPIVPVDTRGRYFIQAAPREPASDTFTEHLGQASTLDYQSESLHPKKQFEENCPSSLNRLAENCWIRVRLKRCQGAFPFSRCIANKILD